MFFPQHHVTRRNVHSHYSVIEVNYWPVPYEYC